MEISDRKKGTYLKRVTLEQFVVGKLIAERYPEYHVVARSPGLDETLARSIHAKCATGDIWRIDQFTGGYGFSRFEDDRVAVFYHYVRSPEKDFGRGYFKQTHYLVLSTSDFYELQYKLNPILASFPQPKAYYSYETLPPLDIAVSVSPGANISTVKHTLERHGRDFLLSLLRLLLVGKSLAIKNFTPDDLDGKLDILTTLSLLLPSQLRYLISMATVVFDVRKCKTSLKFIPHDGNSGITVNNDVLIEWSTKRIGYKLEETPNREEYTHVLEQLIDVAGVTDTLSKVEKIDIAIEEQRGYPWSTVSGRALLENNWRRIFNYSYQRGDIDLSDLLYVVDIKGSELPESDLFVYLVEIVKRVISGEGDIDVLNLVPRYAQQLAHSKFFLELEPLFQQNIFDNNRRCLPILQQWAASQILLQNRDFREFTIKVILAELQRRVDKFGVDSAMRWFIGLFAPKSTFGLNVEEIANLLGAIKPVETPRSNKYSHSLSKQIACWIADLSQRRNDIDLLIYSPVVREYLSNNLPATIGAFTKLAREETGVSDVSLFTQSLREVKSASYAEIMGRLLIRLGNGGWLSPSLLVEMYKFCNRTKREYLKQFVRDIVKKPLGNISPSALGAVCGLSFAVEEVEATCSLISCALSKNDKISFLDGFTQFSEQTSTTQNNIGRLLASLNMCQLALAEQLDLLEALVINLPRNGSMYRYQQQIIQHVARLVEQTERMGKIELRDVKKLYRFEKIFPPQFVSSIDPYVTRFIQGHSDRLPEDFLHSYLSELVDSVAAKKRPVKVIEETAHMLTPEGRVFLIQKIILAVKDPIEISKVEILTYVLSIIARAEKFRQTKGFHDAVKRVVQSGVSSIQKAKGPNDALKYVIRQANELIPLVSPNLLYELLHEIKPPHIKEIALAKELTTAIVCSSKNREELDKFLDLPISEAVISPTLPNTWKFLSAVSEADITSSTVPLVVKSLNEVNNASFAVRVAEFAFSLPDAQLKELIQSSFLVSLHRALVSEGKSPSSEAFFLPFVRVVTKLDQMLSPNVLGAIGLFLLRLGQDKAFYQYLTSARDKRSLREFFQGFASSIKVGLVEPSVYLRLWEILNRCNLSNQTQLEICITLLESGLSSGQDHRQIMNRAKYLMQDRYLAHILELSTLSRILVFEAPSQPSESVFDQTPIAALMLKKALTTDDANSVASVMQDVSECMMRSGYKKHYLELLTKSIENHYHPNSVESVHKLLKCLRDKNLNEEAYTLEKLVISGIVGAQIGIDYLQYVLTQLNSLEEIISNLDFEMLPRLYLNRLQINNELKQEITRLLDRREKGIFGGKDKVVESLKKLLKH